MEWPPETRDFAPLIGRDAWVHWTGLVIPSRFLMIEPDDVALFLERCCQELSTKEQQRRRLLLLGYKKGMTDLRHWQEWFAEVVRADPRFQAVRCPADESSTPEEYSAMGEAFRSIRDELLDPAAYTDPEGGLAKYMTDKVPWRIRTSVEQAEEVISAFKAIWKEWPEGAHGVISGEVLEATRKE